jgi:regulator of protease activity HflC (stomatin/prohibitin superfamily)
MPSKGPALTQGVADGEATRQAARAVAAAPPASLWLVAVPGDGSSTGAPLFVNVAHKGAVLSAAAAEAAFPSARLAAQAAAPPPAAVLAAWREMAATMVTVHQRRGEGELVATWLYQLLALDAGAPEWGPLLGRSGG